MTVLHMPQVQGRLTQAAPLAPLVWFKSGGCAQYLYEPKDIADLQSFLHELDQAVPVMALGLGSNLIIRDGGVRGVVIRLGKAFAAQGHQAFWCPPLRVTIKSLALSFCAPFREPSAALFA
jgi:UDP-N-acetylmuramate dehydrogenase